MLNFPIVHKEIQQIDPQKISSFEEIEYKQMITKIWWRNKQEITTVLKKNSTDGKFTIIIKNIPFTNKSFVVSLNNKINYMSPDIESKSQSDIIITSSNLKGTLFKDVSTIAIAINAKVSLYDTYVPFNRIDRGTHWERISELNIKLKKHDLSNKSFLINDEGLLVETYSSIIFIQDLNKVIVKNVKSQIKILPKKIVSGKHNINMFCIINLSRTEPPLIVAKTIEGLKIHNALKKNKVIFNKSNNAEDSVKGILGNISFVENTYYDAKNENTYSGIGLNSKKGYIVPHNFKGDMIPILNVDIDSISNILIGFSNPIKNAYLDKESGLIKLTINESIDLYDDDYQVQNTISNFNFANVISGNLSLMDIINLEKNV